MQLDDTGPVVQVTARPAAVRLDPGRTAVIVVDYSVMQSPQTIDVSQ